MNLINKINWFRTKFQKYIKITINKNFKRRQKYNSELLTLPLVIYYRISDTGYPKTKPQFIGNENCLRNAVKHFPPHENKWVVIADNCCDATIEMIKKYIPKECINIKNIGHGAGTFRITLEMALKLNEKTPVYFLENDYLHRENSKQAILEGLKLAPYVTLYDHPDKYDNNNFMVKHGGEKTRVMISSLCHWKVTHSTTMTFAAKIETLRKDKMIFDRWTKTKHPYDCEIFIELSRKGRELISPLPSYSTHGETAYLAPLINWEKVIE